MSGGVPATATCVSDLAYAWRVSKMPRTPLCKETAMRSAIPGSSGSLDEITITPAPVSAASMDQLMDCRLGPNVDATRRSRQDKDRGRTGEDPGKDHLLPVPARQG